MDNSLTIDENLSIEELSVLFAYADETKQGQSLLEVAYGTLTPEEKHGRLLAATHSLLARGLLVLSNRVIAPATNIRSLVNLYLNSECIFRLGRTGEYGEIITAYHLGREGILRQKTVNGVAYKFVFPFPRTEIINDVCAFYTPIFTENSKIWVALPNSLLADFQINGLRTFEKIFEYLRQTSSDDDVAKSLATDIAEAQWRGSMIWMETRYLENLLTRGALLVQGETRLWKIQSTEHNLLRAESIGKEEFVSLIESLIVE